MRRVKESVLEWLQEEDQPAVRAQALIDLLDRSPSDPEVREARRQVPQRGWAADTLAEQLPSGHWVWTKDLYAPKYLATNWRLLVMADLGGTEEDPRVRQSAELLRDWLARPDGGFATPNRDTGHLCITGNTARMLLQLGYGSDPRVRSALGWLVREQREDGGWNCFGGEGTLDCWEPLSAFAAVPQAERTRAIQRAVERGAAFYLERELHREGRRYAPWFRLHYPVHYYYDLLVGLDVLTSLGYADDERLRYAVDWLREKQRPDGTWLLDAVHPDVAGEELVWLREEPRPYTPWALEHIGAPSKLVTLRALRVLKRVGESTV